MAAAPARSDLAEARHECEICYDTVPLAATLALCGEGHRFCAECAWRCCESALSDGLVPACPKATEARCGTVSREVARSALTRWLTDPEADTRSRMSALASWEVCGAAGGVGTTTFALNLATLTTRFVYPQFSLEGKRLWIVGLSPLGLNLSLIHI